jgi:mannose-1-phosphate guanylyltransferase
MTAPKAEAGTAGPSAEPSAPQPAVVIMAGGAGTRFWPLSTARRPKQFLTLLSERSLLQEAYDRAVLLAPPERILVLTNEGMVGDVQRELPDLAPENIVGEPQRRDTAAPVALAALLLEKRLGDPVMVVLTADHRIAPVDRFRYAVLEAAAAARHSGALYTFGIPPTGPATGYGYLEIAGEPLGRDEPSGCLTHRVVRSFREKPDLATAETFFRSGRFLWNSGMFVWSVSSILRELGQWLPTHLEQLRPVLAAKGEQERKTELRRAFAALPAVSIDRGVMEKAEQVRTVVAPFEWSDVGGWEALAEFLPDDGRGNRKRGQLTTLDATGNLVFNEDPEELVALVGVRDLVVVRSGTRTLVVDRARCEEVKELVQRLESQGLGRHE